MVAEMKAHLIMKKAKKKSFAMHMGCICVALMTEKTGEGMD
jgi:hypothetical protein